MESNVNIWLDAFKILLESFLIVRNRKQQLQLWSFREEEGRLTVILLMGFLITDHSYQIFKEFAIWYNQTLPDVPAIFFYPWGSVEKLGFLCIELNMCRGRNLLLRDEYVD